jgi:hypothetical protein
MTRPVKKTPPKVAQATKKTTKKSAKVAKPSSVGAGSPIARICRAVAELDAIYKGHAPPPRAMVALLAGYDAESAGFKKALGEAKKKGVISYGKGKDTALELTALGQKTTPKVDPPRDNEEMLSKLKDLLLKKKAPQKVSIVLELLADGNAHSIAEIAERTDYPNQQSAGFKKFIGIVGSMNHFFVREGKMLKLGDAAFPYGRPV